jgi:Acetyltransferase (GNAT) domain
MEVQSPFTGRRGVCLPFSDFCDPLIFGESGSLLVIERLTELAQKRKWKHFEIRGGCPFVPSSQPAAVFYGHRLDLHSGIEELYAGLKSSVRRALRKAKRNGLSLQVTHTLDGVEAFYQLHGRTRRSHGLPPQPESFFLNIYSEVIKPGFGFVVLANDGSRPIAALVFFHFGKKAVYKFGASDERLKDLQGNTLVMWGAISFLVKAGIEELHFGRTAVDNHGLRRFKLAWGVKEETIQYLRFHLATRLWITDGQTRPRFHTAVFRRLPLAVNRLAGAIIYPHLD